MRTQIADLPEALPEAWPFGATAAHADELLDLVLAGTKTATASSVRDYEADGDPIPQVGELSIILDGAGTPRAVLRVTDIAIVPFNEVTAEHAYLEGESDRTLESWRDIHERYWTNYSSHALGYDEAMPIVCERFELVYPAGG